MRVIIFDGICSFCNASVDLLMRWDKNKRFRFTANQNESGKTLLEEAGFDSTQVETIYYYEDGQMYTKSTAILKIARQLPFPFPLAYVFMVVPKFIRDGIYSFIAKNRYRWFGKRDTCRVPTPEERARFLA
ncbi:MAG: DCC1-like thiol-disulfide oxidoreductase family protein [Bacteroidia bacterium]|nr:DCC1-like thiol-disulfide oxidoreductase family protein [Bacteroidia bacterium]